MDGLWVRGGRMVLALSTLLSWGPPGHAGPIANAPPVELFAAPPLFESPRLSPGGSKLVARMLINGAQSLVVFPLTSGGKPARLKIPDETELNDWRWVNDDWLLLSIGRADRIEGIEIYVTRLAGVNAAFTKWIPIDWERSGISADNVLWIAHDGSTRIIFQKQTGIDREDQFDPTVFEADVATGKVRELVHSRSDISGWYADGNGRVRFGTGHTDRRWTMIYRDATTDKFTSIPNHYAFDQSPPVPLIYRPDGSAVVIDDKSGFGAVRSLALPSFTLGETIFALPDYDVDGVILNPARDGLLGVNYTDHVDHDSWFDADLKTVQQGFDKAVGAGNAHIVSLSRDGHTMLVVVGSAAQAGALYYYDIGEGAMHRLGFNNEQLKNQQLSAVKSIRYRARDGTSIEAVLTLPRGLAAKNLPLIVMPHGGPYARDSEQYDWWVQYLAAQGYAVIQPNYRGSTGYGDAFEKLGEGQWGAGMQDDLIDAVKWLAGEGIADPKRVCIVGASYGGYAAIRAAQRDGATYRCAISFAGVSDLSAMRRYDRKFLQSEKFANSYWKAQAPDFAAVSPRFHAAEFSIPLLLVHGNKDKRVPVAQSRWMADQLKAAGKPYQYIEQPLADHHFTREADRLEFLKATKAFLDRYNPS